MAATKREWYITGDDGSEYIYTSYQFAQTFTIGNTGVDENFNITSVKIKAFRYKFPETLYFDVYAVDGEQKPTGEALSTGSVDPTGWDTTPAWHEIDMTEYTLLASTQYVLVFRTPDSSDETPAGWQRDASDPTYAGGDMLNSTNGGSTWNHGTGYDFMFEIWGEPAVGFKELAGEIAISSTTNGTLKANRKLVGTSIIGSTTTGELVSPTRELAGTSVISSTVVGEIAKTAVKLLSGMVAIASSVAGGILRTRGISGAVAIASIVTGELVSLERLLAGTVTIKSIVTGEISKAEGKALSGVITIAATVSGELVSPLRLLKGKIVIASSVSGELLSIAAGRTYFTYENGNIVFYVAGCEAMRIKADGTGVDIKGTLTENAFL